MRLLVKNYVAREKNMWLSKWKVHIFLFGAENFFLTIPPWGGGIFLLRKDKNCARKSWVKR